MDKHSTNNVLAIVTLCLMAFVFGMLIAPKIADIGTINSCNQKTIDANHNGISDYLEKTVAAGGYCGDGICDTSTENSISCPTDCTSSSSSGYCGDGMCDPKTENSVSCPIDCPVGYCGDGICDTATENNVSCPIDCGGGYIGYFH